MCNQTNAVPAFGVPKHSQYTFIFRVKLLGPATLLAIIWYTPLSSRVISAIVKLVALTMNLVSVTVTPFLVNVMLSFVVGGLASKEKKSAVLLLLVFEWQWLERTEGDLK